MDNIQKPELSWLNVIGASTFVLIAGKCQKKKKKKKS